MVKFKISCQNIALIKVKVTHRDMSLKGHCVVLEKKFKLRIFNIYNINEVIKQSLKYLLFHN